MSGSQYPTAGNGGSQVPQGIPVVSSGSSLGLAETLTMGGSQAFTFSGTDLTLDGGGGSGSAGVVYAGTLYPTVAAAANITMFAGSAGTLEIEASSGIVEGGTIYSTLVAGGNITLSGTGADLTIASTGAGALTKINTFTVSGSSSTLECLSVFSSTYDDYLIELVGIQASANGTIGIQIGIASGPTFGSGNYWSASGNDTAGDAISDHAQASTVLGIFPNYNTNAGLGAQASLVCRGVGSNTVAPCVLGTAQYDRSGSGCIVAVGGTGGTGTGVQDSLNLVTTAGSLTAGTVRVYGYSK